MISKIVKYFYFYIFLPRHHLDKNLDLIFLIFLPQSQTKISQPSFFVALSCPCRCHLRRKAKKRKKKNGGSVTVACTPLWFQTKQTHFPSSSFPSHHFSPYPQFLSSILIGVSPHSSSSSHRFFFFLSNIQVHNMITPRPPPPLLLLISFQRQPFILFG